MASRQREIVEFTGLKTYFFPNIALYAEHNDELFAIKPEKVNPVAAYIFGASEIVPTEQDVVDIFFPDNSNPETLSTGMDACLAMGDNFLTFFKSIGDRLNLLKNSHDLSEIIETKNHAKLVSIAKISRLKKGIHWKILSILVKTVLAESKFDKYIQICELCSLSLDFDAYVLIKLMGLETEETVEEVEIIRDNVIDQLEKTKPGLADLMRNGPIDKFSRLLSLPIDQETCDDLVSHIIDTYNQNLLLDHQEIYDNPNLIEQRAHLNYQLYFLIVRCLSSSENRLHVAQSITTYLTDDVRKMMFPGLQNSRVEKTMEFAHSVIQCFLNSNGSFAEWNLVGIEDLMDNPFSRHAITDILDSFRFSIKMPKLFDRYVALVPESRVKPEDLVKTVDQALRFATWIINNYENSMDQKSIKDLFFLDEKKAKEYVKDVKEALGFSGTSADVAGDDHVPMTESAESKQCLLNSDAGSDDVDSKVHNVTHTQSMTKIENVTVDVPLSRHDPKTTKLLKLAAEKMEEMVKVDPNTSSEWSELEEGKLLDNDSGKPSSPTFLSKKDGNHGEETPKFSNQQKNSLIIQTTSQQNVTKATKSPKTTASWYPFSPKKAVEPEIEYEPRATFGHRPNTVKYEDQNLAVSTEEPPHSTPILNDECVQVKTIPKPTPLLVEKPAEDDPEMTPTVDKMKHRSTGLKPSNNFIVSGFGGAQLAHGFGKVEFYAKRRLFGGVGVGEIRRFSGYV